MRSTGGWEEPLIAAHSRAEEEQGTSAGLDGVAPGSATMDRSGGGGGGGGAVLPQQEQVSYNYSQVGRGWIGRAVFGRAALAAWAMRAHALQRHARGGRAPGPPARRRPTLLPPARPPTDCAALQFYLVFALASMYIAMLMTGWGAQAGEAKVRARRGRRIGADGGGEQCHACLPSCQRALAVVLTAAAPPPTPPSPPPCPTAVLDQCWLDERVGQGGEPMGDRGALLLDPGGACAPARPRLQRVMRASAGGASRADAARTRRGACGHAAAALLCTISCTFRSACNCGYLVALACDASALC